MGELCVLMCPPLDFLMSGFSSFRGYLDDSEGEKVFILAGYVAPLEVWGLFESGWSNLLIKGYGLKYFHMKELVGRSGEFAGWPSRGDPDIEPLVANLLSDLAVATALDGMKGYGIIIPDIGLDKFNLENKLCISAKQIAVFLMDIILCNNYDVDLQVILDRMNKANDAIDFSEECFFNWFGVSSKITFSALSRGGSIGAKNTPTLQAADYLAWELRVDYQNKRGFYESYPFPQLDKPEALHQLVEWTIGNRNMIGLSLPRLLHRRPFIALQHCSPIYSFIADYDALCKMNSLPYCKWPRRVFR
jgi:hypothetical protein